MMRYPPLTSVRVFPELVGKSLAEMLLERIARESFDAVAVRSDGAADHLAADADRTGAAAGK